MRQSAVTGPLTASKWQHYSHCCQVVPKACDGRLKCVPQPDKESHPASQSQYSEWLELGPRSLRPQVVQARQPSRPRPEFTHATRLTTRSSCPPSTFRERAAPRRASSIIRGHSRQRTRARPASPTSRRASREQLCRWLALVGISASRATALQRLPDEHRKQPMLAPPVQTSMETECARESAR